MRNDQVVCLLNNNLQEIVQIFAFFWGNEKMLAANYVSVAFRRVTKTWRYTAINVFGLALGLTIFLFVTTFAHFERTYDSFFGNADRIFVPHYDFGPKASWGGRHSVSTRPALAPYFKELTAVEAVATVGTFQAVADIGQGRKFTEVVRSVGSNFFTVFGFDFLSGSPDSLWQDTGAILLSSRLADKYFRGTSALGRTITIDGKASFRVTGVFKDLPHNSHFTSSWNPAQLIGFDFVISKAALHLLEKRERAQEWQPVHAFNTTYLQIKRGVNTNELTLGLERIAKTHLQPDLLVLDHWGYEPQEDEISIKLRPITGMNMHLWEVLNIPGPFLAELLGFLVLVAAVMNYTGLAIAQVIGRSKEVAIRKTLGASRSNLFFQFMAESFIIVLIAGLLATAALEILLPFSGELIGRNLTLDIYDESAQFRFFAGTLLLTSFAAGAYPGLILARMQVTSVFSGSLFKGSRRKKLRNFMLALQFALTAIFLACIAVMILQFKKAWVGTDAFDVDNIVLMRSNDLDILARANALKNELRQTGVVKDVSITSTLPFRNSHRQKFVASGNPVAPVWASYKRIDAAYFKIFNLKLLAGRSLTEKQDKVLRNEAGEALQGNAVITESMAKLLGWQGPLEAIDQSISSLGAPKVANMDFTIVGVVKDLAVDDPTIDFPPIVYAIQEAPYARVVATIRHDAKQTRVRADLREAWLRVFGETDQRLDVFYLKEWYHRGKQALRALLSGFVAIALAALGLSVVGLFGFAAFLAETRSVEMSIRKVYGASKRDIVGLMLWQFIRPAFVGALVGVMLAYGAVQQTLQAFSSRELLDFLPFFTVVVILVLMALGITFAHALRVARVSPIAHLRRD